jgi:hypothetical protein
MGNDIMELPPSDCDSDSDDGGQPLVQARCQATRLACSTGGAPRPAVTKQIAAECDASEDGDDQEEDEEEEDEPQKQMNAPEPLREEDDGQV